jgi:hypothetical protein
MQPALDGSGVDDDPPEVPRADLDGFHAGLEAARAALAGTRPPS